MGDLGSSDCSWKKMVIAKTNNKWFSTIQLEQDEMDNTVSATDLNSANEQIVEDVKKEREENCEDDDRQTEMAIDVDPHMLLASVGKRRRRHSSGASKCESPGERSSRLAKMSAYAAQRLANESPAARANRLKRMSEYAAKRLAHETSDQRAKRLSRMSAYAAKRLASETQEQRNARLARMSAYAAKRQAMKKHLSSKSGELSNEKFSFT